MCHVLWLLPILGLPLFWVLDFGVALPLYLGLLGITAGATMLAVGVMRKPASSGIEAMHGSTAEAVEDLRPRGKVQYRHQLWYASASTPVTKGETVRIVGNRGLCLLVEKVPLEQDTAVRAEHPRAHFHLIPRR